MVSCLDHSGWSQRLRWVQLPGTRGRFGVKKLSCTWKSHQSEHQWDKVRRCSAGLGGPANPPGGQGELAGGGERVHSVCPGSAMAWGSVG